MLHFHTNLLSSKALALVRYFPSIYGTLIISYTRIFFFCAREPCIGWGLKLRSLFRDPTPSLRCISSGQSPVEQQPYHRCSKIAIPVSTNIIPRRVRI
ncbi:uncharacterized protein CANTADRAFT_122428 [Suhomyces tanzawaensis NRRL Y-17324]|uniref:Uncharacterized protein n=1 Tax=Suhomyces tanzawaensis NRRL Y-17324 TaxID=984487 RepID=A0A1E4SQN8_9ASCO|nr:uncharacterized protein CANTADRAFT_122428 [Suhomyces tanzawaensis NRRL Y-17324]ODV81826.1 hypothetical protein CANTADRAFT_122428 [Suhomyces tanzawaensis NRRL Y-17324]